MDRYALKQLYNCARAYNKFISKNPRAYGDNYTPIYNGVTSDIRLISLSTMAYISYTPPDTNSVLKRYGKLRHKGMVNVHHFEYESCDRHGKNLAVIIRAIHDSYVCAIGVKRYADGSGRLTIRMSSSFVTGTFASYTVMREWIAARRNLRNVPIFEQYAGK